MVKFSGVGAALALALGVASSGASAEVFSLVGPAVTGAYTSWSETTPGTLTFVPNGSVSLSSLLAGSAAAPGGYVELNKFAAAPATTLTGLVNGHSVTLSSLTLADWTANSNSLTSAYISAAYQAAFGTTISPSNLALAIAGFYAPNSALGGIAPYKFVSDPNVSYVLQDGGSLKVGLAGFLDATPFLKLINPLAPAGSQASEVVKLTYNGATSYLFGFTATNSGVASADHTGFSTGNYEVSVKAVPLPGTLSLIGLGLAGLAGIRRRKA